MFTSSEEEGCKTPTLNDIYEDFIDRACYPCNRLDTVDRREPTPSQFLVGVCFNRLTQNASKLNEKKDARTRKSTTSRRRVSSQRNSRPKAKLNLTGKEPNTSGINEASTTAEVKRTSQDQRQISCGKAIQKCEKDSQITKNTNQCGLNCQDNNKDKPNTNTPCSLAARNQNKTTIMKAVEIPELMNITRVLGEDEINGQVRKACKLEYISTPRPNQNQINRNDAKQIVKQSVTSTNGASIIIVHAKTSENGKHTCNFSDEKGNCIAYSDEKGHGNGLQTNNGNKIKNGGKKQREVCTAGN